MYDHDLSQELDEDGSPTLPDLRAAMVGLHDFQSAARAKAKREVWDFLEGGSCDELSLDENVLAYQRVWLRPRVLSGVEAGQLSTTILGQTFPSPVMLAPVGLQALFHPEGELATARAAAAMGALFVVSMMSTVSLEQIAATGVRYWLQLYLMKDRSLTGELVREAERLGCCGIVMTVDAPRIGHRERDLRNAFCLPTGVVPALVPDVALHRGKTGSSAISRHASSAFEAKLHWSDVDWLRSQTSLPIVLKGLSAVEDVQRAASEGVAGVILSNHGGRQLDGARASLDSLREVAPRVDGRCELYLDGGVRRGTDVLKAGALGARAVFVGRPLAWGLMVGGTQGVTGVLRQLNYELDLALVLCGCASFEQLDRGVLCDCQPGRIHRNEG